jgi:uncharacterized protein (DUF433 family)
MAKVVAFAGKRPPAKPSYPWRNTNGFTRTSRPGDGDFGIGSRRSFQHEITQSRKLRPGMNGLRQVEELLPSLSRAEKAHLLRLVVQDLDDAFPGIDSTPGVCGGEPYIVRTRVPVWVLEQSRRLGMSEDELLRSYPTLRAEDLVNAWAHVRSHRTEIEDEIRENENA